MKTLTIFVLGCLVAGCFGGILGIGKTQSAAVKGVLTCNGQPAENIKVKLYDEDRTDLDDLMDEGVTDSQGRFELRGHETEITTIGKISLL